MFTAFLQYYGSVLRQILGETITKGSVYVLFDEGSKAKWAGVLCVLTETGEQLFCHGEVRPSDINVLLKKPGWSPQARYSSRAVLNFWLFKFTLGVGVQAGSATPPGEGYGT